MQNKSVGRFFRLARQVTAIRHQSFSTNAGNPYFIDMDILREEGLLKKSDYSKLEWGKDREKC